MADVVIEVREPGRQPLRLVLSGVLTVGRDCDGLLLTDQQISRRHLEIGVTPFGVEVVDLGSSNGTYVNGGRIVTATAVTSSDSIRLGSSTISIVASEHVPIDPRATTIAPQALGRLTSIDQVADLVAADVATSGPKEHDEGTITIVFSDIEGSTERVGRAGDDEWVAVLARHNTVIRDAVRRHRGRVVKSQGDGFMITFASARRAVRAMSEVQQSFDDDPIVFDGSPLRVRVGMHTGEVIVDDGGDLFGMHVHYAARVAGHATGGEVLVSSLTRAILGTRNDVVFGAPRLAELKGLQGTHELSPVLLAVEGS